MSDMATPRAQLVDPEQALCYHLVSRCVRRAWLCGLDESTHIDYSHRKTWLEQRLSHLGRCFAIDIYAHAIMSNHFHLVLYFDPTACHQWSDDEVAERWMEAFPPKINNTEHPDARELYKQALINHPKRLARCRASLGSLSSFMQHLKQPIARRANREDGVSGHFFEQRFYSGALLSENAMLAAMAYVDLNPVRARIAQHIEECHHTSIVERLNVVENDAARLKQALMPTIAGLRRRGVDDKQTTRVTHGLLGWTLRQYIDHLCCAVESTTTTTRNPSHSQWRWIQQVASLGKRQRAYGSPEQLSSWAAQRNMRRLEVPIP